MRLTSIRLIVPLALGILAAPLATDAQQVVAGDTPSERATLKGLTGLHVIVERIDPDAERDGLTRSALQTDVELKLRQAGIGILDARAVSPGNPYLRLNVVAVKGSTEIYPKFYIVGIELQLNQEVYLGRNPSVLTFAVTWSARGRVGVYEAGNLPAAREPARDIVDEFIKAYVAANPKVKRRK